MIILDDITKDSNGNTTITFHDIRDFSGIFYPRRMDDELFQYVQGMGICFDKSEGLFVVSTTSHVSGKEEVFRFTASTDGMKEWSDFIIKNVNPKAVALVCADESFFRFAREEYKPKHEMGVRSPFDELTNEERYIQFQLVYADMAIAYLSLLHDTMPDYKMLSNFLALVALDPHTYQFLTWDGMAHSAQDIFQFINRKKILNEMGVDEKLLEINLMDGLIAQTSSGGVEMYYLHRTDETPDEIDSTQLGLDYFSTESRYNHLPKSYSIKLTVLNICKKYAIMMGYHSSIKNGQQNNNEGEIQT